MANPKIQIIVNPVGPGTIDLEVNSSPFKTLSTSPYNLDIVDSNNVSVGTPDSLNNKVTIGDVTVNVNKSDSTLISSLIVEAEGTDNFNVPDSVIENSDASYLVNVLATDGLILPDVDIEILDQSNNVIDTDTIPSVKNHLIDVYQYCQPTNFERKFEFSNPYNYCGLAANGTLITDNTWTITRIEVFLNGTTDVKTATGAWTNRLTLTYI